MTFSRSTRARQKKRSQERFRDALSTFVPQTIKWILQNEDKVSAPYRKQFQTVALFADISGFTKITETLSTLRALGTETLVENINAYLSLIVKEVIGAGGDIFKFAGDALLCLWPPAISEMNDMAKQMAVLPDTIHRVMQCALDVQKKFGELNRYSTSANNDTLTLRVKLGIGVGTVDVIIVGGVMGRYEYLAAGEAFHQAFNCENDCNPLEVVISEKCHRLCRSPIQKATPVGKQGNFLLHSLNSKLHKKAFESEAMRNDDEFLLNKLGSYIPSAVVPHLKMPGMQWAGELRQVTILFMSLPFNAEQVIDMSTDLLKRIHKSVQLLQNVIYKYQGSFNKFLVDDKGTTVIAVFGLPPVAHSNDPARGIMAALELQSEFTAFNLRHQVYFCTCFIFYNYIFV